MNLAAIAPQRLLQAVTGWIAGARRGEDDIPVPVRGSYTPSTGKVSLAQFDQTLLWVIVGLLAFSLVMVYSASIALPDNPRSFRYSHTHFLVRQSIAVCLGLVGGLREGVLEGHARASSGTRIRLVTSVPRGCASTNARS